jgi:PAS domain S-box-containing protein
VNDTELRYRTLIEQLPLVTYVDALDDRSSNIYTSPQLEPILGYSVEEWQEDEDLFVRILHPDDRERVLAQIRETNASGERFQCEYRLIAKDGRVIWFRDESVVVRDESGTPLYSQGYLLDITDRKTAETEARESIDDLRRAQEALVRREAVLDAVAGLAGELVAAQSWGHVDVVGRLREAVRTSRAYLVQHVRGKSGRGRGRLLAESTDGTVGSLAETASDGCFEYDAEGFGAFRAALEQGEIVRRIASDFPASEQHEWAREGVRSTLVVPIQVGGDYWGHIGFQDCSEERVWTDAEVDALRAGAGILGAAIHRTTTRDALAESEARFAAFMDTTPAIAFAKDVDGRYVYANARWQDLFGQTLDELLGRTDTELFPDRASDFRVHDAAALETGGAVSKVERVRVGETERTLMTAKFPFRDASGEEYVGGVALDITEREQAEQELRATTRLLESIVQSAPVAIVTSDSDGLVTGWNPAAEEMFGWSREEVLGQRPPHFVPGDSDGDDSRARAQAGVTVADAEGRRLRRDGTVVWVRYAKAPLYDANGDVSGTTAILTDVTERKAAEDALVETTQTLAAIVDSSPLAIVTFDRHGAVTSWNDAAARTFGWTAEEVLGQFNPMLPEGERDWFLQMLALALEGRSWRGVELVRRRKDGTPIDVSVSSAPLRGASGEVTGMVAMLADVTERRRAERRLAAQHAVTRVLAESTTLDDAAPKILEEVCRALDWEIGGLWTVDPTVGRLRLASIWHPGDPRFERFVDESWSLELDRGEGFPGAVWETGETRWYADVAGSSRSRATAVASASLHGAIATPIVSGGEVLGVLELFSTRVWDHDDELVAMLASVGGQVGQFLRRAQSDREVREREERFRTLVANLPGAIYRCAVDEDRTLSFLSDVIREITGYPASDLIDNASRSFASVIHPDDRATVVRVIRDAVRRKEPFELEYRIVHADGSIRWVAERGQPIIGPGGTVLWLDGAIFDVTEQHAAEAALAAERDRIARTNHLLDSIVENLPTPLFLKDADDLRFARVNRAAEELWGIPRATLIGKNDRDFFPAAQADFFMSKDRRVLDEQELLDIPEEPLETKGLGTRYLHTRKVPIVDETGRSRYLLGISEDITEQRRAAAELERLLEQLEQQNERLRELDRMKDEFVALVSHELRTPLTSILGYLELVLEGEAGEISDDQAHFLAIIERNAQRLLRLVGDLLFVAQIEAGRLAIERGPCDVAQLASDCVEAARPRAVEKQIDLTLRAALNVELVGDRTRMAQLLDNLISNAIKFTSEGGRVEIRLQTDGRSVLIEVSDTGMGIAPEDQERLFERFFRTAEATRRAIQGTGLGLAITKAIAEAHGGSIGVRSEVGVGTTFVVELPFLPQPSGAPEPVSIEQAGGSP